MTPHKNTSALGVYGQEKVGEQWQAWAVGIIVALVIVAVLMATHSEPSQLDCLLTTGSRALCN